MSRQTSQHRSPSSTRVRAFQRFGWGSAIVNRLACQVLVAAALLAPALAPSTAAAQFGSSTGFAEAFKPDYLNRDMAIFNEYLGLEDWQRPIIETLLDDYNTSFQAGVDAVKAQMQQVNAAGEGRNVAKIMAPVEAWMSDKQRIGAEFIENVKSQLSDAQLSRWPRFERAMRRDKELHRGELSGESVNLIALIRNLRLDATTQKALEPVIEQYEIELDLALQARQRVMDAQQEQVKQAMVNMDFDSGIDAVERIMAARVNVREAQDRGAAMLIAALPPDKGQELLKSWRQAAYPKVYRSNHVDRLFELALELEGLSEEQRTRILELKETYEGQLEALNAQLLDIYQADEPKEARRKAETIRARQTGGAKPARAEDPAQDVLARREKLLDETRKALEAILTPEQLAKLPVAPKGRSVRNPDASFGPDRGVRGDRPAREPGRLDRGRQAGGDAKGGDPRRGTGGTSRPPGNAAE